MAEPPPLMHATQVARPFHTPGWVYDEKVDGWRMLAVKEEGAVSRGWERGFYKPGVAGRG